MRGGNSQKSQKSKGENFKRETTKKIILDHCGIHFREPKKFIKNLTNFLAHRFFCFVFLKKKS